MMNRNHFSRRQKRSNKSQARASRSTELAAGRAMELAALEPRMLFCLLHAFGHLPENLGTFSKVAKKTSVLSTTPVSVF